MTNNTYFKDGMRIGAVVGVSLVTRFESDQDVESLLADLDVAYAETNARIARVVANLPSGEDVQMYNRGIGAGLAPFLGSLLSTEPTLDQ